MKKNFYVPIVYGPDESYVLRTTLTLKPAIHKDLIDALEAGQSKAHVIRELMIKGLEAFQLELEKEAEL